MLVQVLTLLAIGARAIVVRGPSGPYPVAHKVVPLIDDSRWDPYAPETMPHKRRILTSVFAPLDIDPAQCERETTEYMPPRTIDTYEVVVDQALGLPGHLVRGYELEFCKLAQEAEKTDASSYPIVIYSPGFSASRLLAAAQVQSLAAQGNIVITVDHPYEATVVEFPNGDIVYGANITDANPENAEPAVRVRADDVSFVIDQLETLCGSFYDRVDPSRILVYGHSLGGATAVNAAYLDERVLGGINFDGTVFGPVAEPGTDKPVLLVGPPIPENSTTTPSEAFMKKLRGPKMLLTIDGTLHLSYFDVPLLLTYREDEIPPEVAAVIDMVLGTIDGNELVEVMNAILKAMIAFLFNDDVEGLCRISKDFPEILEVVEKDLNGCSRCDGTSF